jgi:hypothetical protein
MAFEISAVQSSFLQEYVFQPMLSENVMDFTFLKATHFELNQLFILL